MEGKVEVQSGVKTLVKNGKCFIENSGTIPVYVTEIRGKKFKQNLNGIPGIPYLINGDALNSILL